MDGRGRLGAGRGGLICRWLEVRLHGGKWRWVGAGAHLCDHFHLPVAWSDIGNASPAELLNNKPPRILKANTFPSTWSS